jgi:hypothetical protein
MDTTLLLSRSIVAVVTGIYIPSFSAAFFHQAVSLFRSLPGFLAIPSPAYVRRLSPAYRSRRTTWLGNHYTSDLRGQAASLLSSIATTTISTTHLLLSHNHRYRWTRTAMQVAPRGALAICGRVSQLNALSGVKTGILASIRTYSAFRSSSLPRVAHHAPAPFAQRLLSQTKTVAGRYFDLLGLLGLE